MAIVRIFLPTYRRPALLPRAIASLQAQTCTDWVCEVHNDDPDDPQPAALLSQLDDRRFHYRHHDRNLGGVATFNLFFRAAAEPFYAMLEDDNAWEPEFLTTLLGIAREQQDATVFWCNQQIWHEERDGVRFSGRCVHDAERSGPARRITWGQPEQIFGALHANGAALFRSRPGDAFVTPAIPLALVEAFRERMFPHPMVYVPTPLAQFTRTLRSARSDDRGEWAVAQTLLVASFLRHARWDATGVARVWRRAREQNPASTGTLFAAALMEPALRPLLRFATASDWLRFLRSTARRPGVLRRVLRSPRAHADWWEFLERHTAARFAA